MALLTPAHGPEMLKKLGDALGITFPFSRLVIECDLQNGKPFTCYVVAPIGMERLKKSAELFNSLKGMFEIKQVGSAEVGPDSAIVVEDK